MSYLNMDKQYIYKFIGYNIRKCRKESGITQQLLAGGINKSHASIANYENGKQMPGIDLLYRIALFCGVPINRIIYPILPSITEIKKLTKPIFKVTNCPVLFGTQTCKDIHENKNCYCTKRNAYEKRKFLAWEEEKNSAKS